MNKSINLIKNSSMAKTFLPKGTDLSEEVIVKLQKGFKIFDADILDIEDILKKKRSYF